MEIAGKTLLEGECYGLLGCVSCLFDTEVGYLGRGIEWVESYRTITSFPCQVYGLPSCDIGRRVRECDHGALGDSCDNESCAREKSSGKHCDLFVLMRE